MRPTSDDVGRVALLDEPVRRRLYEYVRRRGRPVGRDEAAAAVGISRSLAAFHLDRLARADLLEVEYRRLTGRTGRGAGRPAKLYRPSSRRVAVSLPQTRYDLAGAVLARALAEGGPEDAERARRLAAERGWELGRRLRSSVGRGSPASRAERALEELGFEPERADGAIRLRNCPFDALVEESADVVCALNHALLAGLLAGLECRGAVAEVKSEPGGCCVRIRAEG